MGRNTENVVNVKETLVENGFSIAKTNPDAAISIGGDGTFLYAERKYPSVPKLLIRDSNICKKCNVDLLADVLHQLKNGEFEVEEHIKLTARIVRKKKTVSTKECANDFVLRNRYLPEAARFVVSVDGKDVDGELIGDGAIISTPFGSTAYFYSITRRTFKEGIGIAFNNTTRPITPLVVKQDSTIIIRLVRKDADFASDNDPGILHLQQGDVIEIKKSEQPARIIRIKKPRIGLVQRIRDRWGRRRSM